MPRLLPLLALVGVLAACTDEPRAPAPPTDTTPIQTLACGADLHPHTVRQAAFEGGVLVDVRTLPEVRLGHLAGAHHVSLLAPGFVRRVDALDLDPDVPILLYCGSGARSAEAARLLCNAGYTAYNAGSYAALTRAGLPTSR